MSNEYTPEQIEGQGYKNTTQDIIDLLESSVDLQTATILEYEEAETLLAALEAVQKERDALKARCAELEARLEGAAARAVEWQKKLCKPDDWSCNNCTECADLRAAVGCKKD